MTPGEVRIGLYLPDLRRSSTESQGIVNYSVGLACALPHELRSGERIVLLYGSEMAGELSEACRAPGVEAIEWPTRSGWPDRLRRDHLSVVRWARQARLDVLHFPKGFIPATPMRATKVVATVHDDIPICYRENTFASPGRRFKDTYFSSALRHTLKRADHVITVSEASREALRARVPSVAGRLTVLPNGVSLPLLDCRPQTAKDRVLVHLGSPRPHKRSLEAIIWSRRFLDEEQDFTLIVTGELSPAAEAAARHPRIVRHRQVMTNLEVATLLRDARAVVFPSIMEGFGLPPVEAACMGTPSVWARAGALPEVMGGAPGGFPPHDDDGFLSALREVTRLGDVETRALVGPFRRRFLWRSVASGALEVYRSLLESEPAECAL